VDSSELLFTRENALRDFPRKLTKERRCSRALKVS